MASNPPPADMAITRAIYLRALGAVFLVAFLSLWWQVDGLIGPDGILPLGDRLRQVGRVIDAHPLTGLTHLDHFLQAPSLAWWLPSRWAPHLLSGAGVLASLAVLAGRYQGPALLVAWLCYLSLSVDGDRFLAFQWDTLLLEVGFASMLVAPWGREPVSRPPAHAWWLLRWILFRLVFFSGVVKLTSGDPTWRDLTAMGWHYETQPLPNPLSWTMHHLPMWFHQLETALTFLIELPLAFLILGPRSVRAPAFGLITLLMCALAFTGNYGFFQLLTLVLALTLLDDHHWLRLAPSKSRKRLTPPLLPPLSQAKLAGSGLVAALLVLISLASAPQRYARVEPPAPVARALELVAPFRTVNHYGLFAVMTTRRPIPVLEVQWDDGPWTELTWRWQTSDPAAAPPWVAPHMPRLDWALWFAGLRECKHHPWAELLLQRVVTGSPAVTALIGDLRLQQRPPSAARLMLYDYRFTKPDSDEAKAGVWWTRELRGPYCSTVSRPHP